jgi:hypothetical protein
MLLWIVLLFVACGLAYLNYVGLPKFLQNQLETELRARGISLQFDRLRLRGFRVLIAKNVQLSQKPGTDGPQLLVTEAELRLDARALGKFDFQISALTVRGGRALWPVIVSNAPPHRFSVDDITTELRFLDGDKWELADFAGRFRNADLRVSGTITNARALRKFVSTRPAVPPSADLQNRISAIATNLEHLILTSPAVIEIHFEGDGRSAESFRGTLQFNAPKVKTPQGQCENVQFKLDLSPGRAANERIHVDLRLKCDAMESLQWQIKQADLTASLGGSLTNQSLTKAGWHLQLGRVSHAQANAEQVILSATTVQQTNDSKLFQTGLSLEAEALQLPWCRSQSNHLSGEFIHISTNFTSLEGKWRLRTERFESDAGKSGPIAFSGQIAPAGLKPDERMNSADSAFWSYLAPYALKWEGQLNRIESVKAGIEKLNCEGQWRAPEILVHKLHADLYGGQLGGSARLNVANRELRSEFNFDFDLHRISQVLTENAQRWLRQFSWDTPPRVSAQARLILPAWTNSQPNWHKDVLPTIELSGNLEGSAGAFRKVPVSSASSHFTLTNFFWRLPDLLVTRPEGKAHLDYGGDMRTQDYRWLVQSQIDLKALKPMLDPLQRRALDYFEFSVPPLIQGEIWGRWQEPELIGFVARVAASNFTFRGETCSDFSATARFTNLFFNFSQVNIRRDNQQITAPWVGYDLSEQLLFVTNGLSTMDPGVVSKVIGPQVRRALEPYHFREPPTVVVNGRLPTADVSKADATFRVAGRSFNYWKFNVPEVSGDLHWRGDALSITNLQAKFYNGKLAWEGHFDFTDNDNPLFQFRASVADADLHSMMADLSSTNSHLEGALSGNLSITSANASDWKSWNGFGNARLRNGFLWEIPIFGGILSPMLDKIAPGLGNSRASAGAATFVIDKSIIQTGDLEVRSPALRLKYEGNVDFDGAVNARVQAEILRDAWGVGRILSLALWPLTKVFEYKVTGTLNEPKSEPLYIPKALMWPFQPLRTLKQIFSVDNPSSPASPPAPSRDR